MGWGKGLKSLTLSGIAFFKCYFPHSVPEDQQGLVGRRGILLLSSGVHA
jgi:hypothetical protein